MSAFQKLKTKLTGRGIINAKEHPYRIVPAFISGGVQYSEFDDTFNLPCLRALTALDFYEEFRQRVSLEYLQKHVDAVDAILSDPKKINIGEVSKLNRNLKERMGIFNFDLAYKLASVIYFDESENPYKYDFKYGREKIEKWKKDMSVDAFFLQTPLQKLIPSLVTSDGSLATYSQIETRAAKYYHDSLTTVLSRAGLMDEQRKN